MLIISTLRVVTNMHLHALRISLDFMSLRVFYATSTLPDYFAKTYLNKYHKCLCFDRQKRKQMSITPLS